MRGSLLEIVTGEIFDDRRRQLWAVGGREAEDLVVVHVTAFSGRQEAGVAQKLAKNCLEGLLLEDVRRRVRAEPEVVQQGDSLLLRCLDVLEQRVEAHALARERFDDHGIRGQALVLWEQSGR